jgi:hypothetical protein
MFYVLHTNYTVFVPEQQGQNFTITRITSRDREIKKQVQGENPRLMVIHSFYMPSHFISPLSL